MIDSECIAPDTAKGALPGRFNPALLVSTQDSSPGNVVMPECGCAMPGKILRNVIHVPRNFPETGFKPAGVPEKVVKIGHGQSTTVPFWKGHIHVWFADVKRHNQEATWSQHPCCL